jgi:hypothetical protein
VVFNASFRTTNYLLLNDLLLTAPKIQSLASIVTLENVSLCIFPNIVKVFQQIGMYEENTYLQFYGVKIHLMMYESIALTFTYAITSVLYLAIRVLLQLVIENASFPYDALVVREHTYVDDILMNSDILEDVLEIKTQTDQLLQTDSN